MKRILTIILILVCLLASYLQGYLSHKPTHIIKYITLPPSYIYTTVKEITIVEVPKYIEVQKIITKVEYKTLDDWDNKDELLNFIADDDTDTHIILKANSEGIISFDGQCEDFAIQLINRAEAIGKRLYFIPLHRSEYAKWYGESIPIGTYHAICCAIIGNDVYYIEPQDDRCWKALELD